MHLHTLYSSLALLASILPRPSSLTPSGGSFLKSYLPSNVVFLIIIYLGTLWAIFSIFETQSSHSSSSLPLQQFSWVPQVQEIRIILFPSLALFSFLSIIIFKLIKPGLISPHSSLCLTDDKYVLDSSDSSSILDDKDNLLSKY